MTGTVPVPSPPAVLLAPRPVPQVRGVKRLGRHRFRAWIRRVGTAPRMAALHAVVLAAVLSGSILALLHTTTLGVEKIAVEQLNAELSAYQAAAGHSGAADLRAVSTSYLRAHAVPQNDLVEVAVPGSWAVANAGGSAIAADPAIDVLSETVPAQTVVTAKRVGSRDLQVLVAPIRVDGAPTGVFLAAVDLTGLQPARDVALRLALAEAAIALVAGVASAYLLLRRLLHAVGRITGTAERIGRDQLDDRLGDQGTTDEVGQLAASFDSMLDRIQAAVNAQHELLSDVSHQLRTPLTVARGHLEVLGLTGAASPQEVRETIDVAIGELDRMGVLVERLLALGRAREPLRRDVHDIDLRSFLADLFSAAKVLAARRWVLHPIPDAVVRFDETEVRGALLNLVDNAVHATAPGDTIALSAELAKGGLAISVEDSGPGIPAAEREYVLDRFARRPSRSDGNGSGLGLAIVGAVCASHRGRVDIGDSPLGGAKVTMHLSTPPAETGTGEP